MQTQENEPSPNEESSQPAQDSAGKRTLPRMQKLTSAKQRTAFNLITLALAAILSLYGCDLIVYASIESPHRLLWMDKFIYPWGLIQYAIFFIFWFITLQAAARSRIFAVAVLIPLIIELTFCGYLHRQYPGVEYSTVALAAFCTSYEQIGTYAEARLFAEWAVEAALILAYAFFLYNRVWGAKAPKVRWWLVAWGAWLILTYGIISCHNTSIPNARFYLAQYKLNDDQFRSWVGVSASGTCERTEESSFREMAEREKCSNAYLPYSRFLIWGDALWGAIFPEKLADPAQYGSTMQAREGKLCVVLYIGESYRQDHTPFSGYSRNTLPLVTAHHAQNIIALPNVISFGTNTLESIYGMLTDASDTSRKATSASFMRIFKKHGFFCTIADGTMDGAPWSAFPQLNNVLSGSYDFLTEYKQAQELQELAKNTLQANDRNMMIVEDGTCHWPYSESTGRIWGDSMVDKYDEARLPADEKLDTLLNELKDQPAILLYVSDHGESLGEEGRNSHGGPLSAMEQRRVAAFIWHSDAYAELYPDIVQNLKDNASTFTSHDHIFHTMPTMGGIHSDIQNPAMDMASPQGTSAH